MDKLIITDCCDGAPVEKEINVALSEPMRMLCKAVGTMVGFDESIDQIVAKITEGDELDDSIGLLTYTAQLIVTGCMLDGDGPAEVRFTLKNSGVSEGFEDPKNVEAFMRAFVSLVLTAKQNPVNALGSFRMYLADKFSVTEALAFNYLNKLMELNTAALRGRLNVEDVKKAATDVSEPYKNLMGFVYDRFVNCSDQVPDDIAGKGRDSILSKKVRFWDAIDKGDWIEAMLMAHTEAIRFMTFGVASYDWVRPILSVTMSFLNDQEDKDTEPAKESGQ